MLLLLAVLLVKPPFFAGSFEADLRLLAFPQRWGHLPRLHGRLDLGRRMEFRLAQFEQLDDFFYWREPPEQTLE